MSVKSSKTTLLSNLKRKSKKRKGDSMVNVPVIRNVRIPLNLDVEIRRIAEYEDRTISKVIQRFLQQAVNKYLEENEQFMLKDKEMRAQRFNDILEESDEIDKDLTDLENEYSKVNLSK